MPNGDPNYTYLAFQPQLTGDVPFSRRKGLNLGEWSNFSITQPTQLTWTVYDKDDYDPDVSFYRLGYYLSHFLIQIANESNFSNPIYNVTQMARHNPNTINGQVQNYRVIYSDDNSAGLRPLCNYSHAIPDNTLLANHTYYFRILPVWFFGYVRRNDETNALFPQTGHTAPDNAATSFVINTVLDVPTIDSFITNIPPAGLGEFGGTVHLSWVVQNAASVFITPSTLPGLGNVSVQGATDVFIENTTTFLLRATNENGNALRELTIPVANATGILPYFVNVNAFPITDLHDGDLLAKVGDTYTLQLYTEYMQNIQLFIAYPRNDGSGIFKKRVTPADLMKNIVDESTTGVDIVIPAPDPPLEPNTAISGAWGYDAIGKDGKNHRKVSGYFKLTSKLVS